MNYFDGQNLEKFGSEFLGQNQKVKKMSSFHLLLMGNVKLTFVNFSAAILHSMCSSKLRKYCIENGEKQVKTKYF